MGLFSSTQPNPTETPYIEQQLACRKKISLCTSCHHHHPNAHRYNANTHSITSITVKTNLPVDIRHKVTYIHDMYISHIFHFRPMTQPNPLKTQIFDPFPTQPNPTRGSTQPMDNSAAWLQRSAYRGGGISCGLAPSSFKAVLNVYFRN